MKVLLGLLGYSCKIHRKRSKSSLNRFSFSENDEHRFERSFSIEENDTKNAHSEMHSTESEPLASTSGAHDGQITEGENKLPSSDQKEKLKEELADQTEGILCPTLLKC